MDRPAVPPSLADEVCDALGTGTPTGPGDVARLYAAWCAGIPFDPVAKSAALAEGRPPPGDDPVEVGRRWLDTGLGSTCWGHCTLLAGILAGAGVRADIGVERMITEEVIDFHSFVVVDLDGDRVLLDQVHPSGPPLPLRAGAVGEHPVYRCGLDDDGGRLEHWFTSPLDGRQRRYAVLSTSLDTRDVRAFCALSVDHSGVGRRFFQRRTTVDAFHVRRPTEDGTALRHTVITAAGAATVEHEDVDRALADAGYRPAARAWLEGAGLVVPGPRPWVT